LKVFLRTLCAFSILV